MPYFENVKFSNEVLFDFNLFSDYIHEGSFDHNANSDWDYYGYRETDYIVTTAHYKIDDERVEFSQDDLNNFIDENELKITELVQKTIDGEN